MQNDFKKKLIQRSFTLIEILVVIFIIILLSAIIFANYRSSESQFALQRSANKLAQNIRQIEEMAMSVKKIGPLGAEIVPEGGYGIYLEVPDKIIIFADCNDNQFYDLGNVCGNPPNKFREKVEDVILESGIEIKSLFPSSLHITFKPPNPTIFVNGVTTTEAVITLSLTSDPNQTKTIKINPVGRIEVE